MNQLPGRYRVTAANRNPPLVHFAIPVDYPVLYKYAEKNNFLEYFSYKLQIVSPVTALEATERLSEEVQYELQFCWPFEPTADCTAVFELYTNYTMEEKRLIDEDQEDVIRMVQEALELDKLVRPKWYFDMHDPWQPGDSDGESNY